MAVLVTDPDLESWLKAERQRCESAQFDEVWEGLTVMAPLPNNNHQDIQANLIAAFRDALSWESPARILAGANVSDRNDGWIQNYRCPDVVVYLPGNKAIDHDTHWEGGPDFLVEILSHGDRAMEKLPFYGKVGVREALLIHRDPWSLQLYTCNPSSAEMRLVAAGTPDDKAELHSGVLPLVFQLQPSTAGRPKIRVLSTAEALKTAGGRDYWLV